MNNSKKINVNYSSLVGLKAELLRKQTEVKDAKANAEVTSIQSKHKVRTKKSKTKKVKIEKELIDTDDIKAHKKSKLMLEAKARLYENLKRSHSNKNEHFLVDFGNKPQSEDEKFDSDDYEDANSDPEEDWVEYEDCFGRTRKCLRRDLSTMQKKDDFVKHEVMKKSQGDTEVEDVRPPDVVTPPKEPEIEIMRRKWEEQTEKLTEKMNIHYQDILFDEARAHGVGYYEFSQDEEMRAKQQANLDALRKETIQKQKEMQNLKEMKDKMEQNRLKAARIRQRIRAGLPPEPTDEELVKNDEVNTDKMEVKAETEEKVESDERKIIEYRKENSLIEIENKIKAFGELLGKRTQWYEMSQEEWVYKRRKDRDEEFAPLYNNFRSSGYLESKNTDQDKDESSASLDDSLSGKNEETSESPAIIEECGTKKTADQLDGTDNQQSHIPHSETSTELSQITMPKQVISNADTESSDSSGSDVIGPMPLYTELPTQHVNFQQTFATLPENMRTELSGIDFSKPPPNMQFGLTSDIFNTGPELVPTSVPPPNRDCLPMEYHLPDSTLLSSITGVDSSKRSADTSMSDNIDSQEPQHILNEDKITAGLKYLRANFEKQKHS
ncbi:coiled-coil domain-containing protein 174 [Neodiprion lecontei]|uniref:Coiled-coil domain-containing protein 174 n=1 Tax=Neodiprion lecontei TaxID=441921 RepID=A0A6J0BCA4_NEOLC|nr:coiled-coil domain-containing protein 174 [Neodiprion lecontei]